MRTACADLQSTCFSCNHYVSGQGVGTAVLEREEMARFCRPTGLGQSDNQRSLVDPAVPIPSLKVSHTLPIRS